MSRAKLVTVIKLMFVGLVLAFVYVLFRSLAGPSNFNSPLNLFDDVMVGQTAARRAGTDKVWVTRLSTVHAQQAEQLESYIRSPRSGCQPEQQLCVLLAKTQRSGIDVTYSELSPMQLPADIPWFGGFVDPSTGEVFDRLGRAYQYTAQQRDALEELQQRE